MTSSHSPEENDQKVSSPDLIELARKRGREHARHLLLYYGLNTVDPDHCIVVNEASEQEIALIQEAGRIQNPDVQIYQEKCKADERAYLQSVENVGGWNAFLEQRQAFHEELDRERQRLWQAQLDLYGKRAA